MAMKGGLGRQEAECGYLSGTASMTWPPVPLSTRASLRLPPSAEGGWGVPGPWAPPEPEDEDEKESFESRAAAPAWTSAWGVLRSGSSRVS